MTSFAVCHLAFRSNSLSPGRGAQISSIHPCKGTLIEGLNDVTFGSSFEVSRNYSYEMRVLEKIQSYFPLLRTVSAAFMTVMS